MWSAQFLSTILGRLSGPGALPGLRLRSSFATPGMVIEIGGQGG